MNRKERKLKHIMIRKWCEGMVLMYQIHQWRNDTAGDVGIVYLKGKVAREHLRRREHYTEPLQSALTWSTYQIYDSKIYKTNPA